MVLDKFCCVSEVVSLDPYQLLLRPMLFSVLKVDPEQAHHQVMTLLDWLADPMQHRDRSVYGRWLQHTYQFQHPKLTQTLWGQTFQNPLGLAAGFDKDGTAAGLWHWFGFGHAELGTVTLHPQPGNPRPRLFRLLSDRAILNRMGFNNQGAASLAQRLAQVRQHQSIPIPLGINLGKSKITPLDQAVEDYIGSFQALQNVGDYFVVNVSSPNTPGLRSLQATEQLSPILAALQDLNHGQKPLFVKIAPDLDWEAIAAVVELAKIHHLSGIIATNTTIRRDHLTTTILPATGNSVQNEAGGISGQPLRQRSTDVIRFIHTETQGRLPIIGVGGVFTVEDAWEKIAAGACLVQIYTGWIYEGPWMVRRILEGLVKKLDEHGFAHLSDAIGCGQSESLSTLTTP